MELSPLVRWCNRFISSGFYLLFGLTPLLLTPINYELFEYNKMIAVYLLTVLIGVSWLIKMVKNQELRIAKTPLDIPIFLFVGSQLVSAFFSIDPHVSWFGYYSRFNGGMWSVFSYALLYYALVSNLDVFVPRQKATKDAESGTLHPIFGLLRLSLITGALVAVYGVLERLGIDKHLWVQDVQNRVFSTLGQPNWLAAYLVALIPLAFALFVPKLIKKHAGHDAQTTGHLMPMVTQGALALLFFVVLLFTRSRSGLFGFVVADLLFWSLLVIRLGMTTLTAIKKHPLTIPVGILHLLMAGIIFINGTGTPALDRFVTFNGLKDTFINASKTTGAQNGNTATPSAAAGPALEVGGTESGTIRKYVWQAAVNAWKSTTKTLLIGTGTETFAFAFYEFRPTGHNLTSEWDFLYNKAHNEYLNYLATTGILGLGSYLLLIGTFVIWFVGHTRRLALGDDQLLRNALFAGWVSILVTNFFGFSVVILQVYFFLFPAIVFASIPGAISLRHKGIRLPGWSMWILAIGGLALILRVMLFWYADTRYALAYRLSRSGLYGQAIPSFISAITLNSLEPTYHDELGSAYATLAVAAYEGNNATQAAQLAMLAVEESNLAIHTSPRNVNFYKTRTKVYYTISALDPSLNTKAIETLEEALPLSPNDPKIYYNLAILVGREGDTAKAITHLLKAKELKPNYRDAYYALWVFYTEEKNAKEARGILETYLTEVDPNDTDFKERLK